jgi:putative membrane protein
VTIGMPDPGGFAVFGVFALVSAIVSLAVGIALLVLLILGIRWLLRNTATGRELTGAARSGPRDDAALAALRERFARGEIDAQEFEERRRVLGG